MIGFNRRVQAGAATAEGGVMYDRHLDGFIRVAECGSFSKAAEELYISPNALIKQIDLLERDVGVKLFVRSTRGVELTPAGVSLAESARAIMLESRKAIEKARFVAGVKTYTVRLATSQLRPITKVSAWWREIEDQHPGIDLSIVSIPDDIRSWPKTFNEIGSIFDVAVAIKPSPTWNWYAKCRMRDLYEVPLVCAVPPKHRLRAKSFITFDDLHGEAIQTAHAGATPSIDELRDFIQEEHPQIEIIDGDPYDLTSMNRNAKEGSVGLICSEWENVHPSFDYIPLEGNWSLTISLLYSPTCDKAVLEFVDAISAQARKYSE